MAEPEIRNTPAIKAKSSNRSYFAYGLLASIFFAASDIISKNYAIDFMYARAGMPFEVTGFFNIVMAWNKGVSFSMLAEYDAKYFLIALSIILSLIIAVWMWRDRTDKLLVLASSMIIGGAMGNMIDRLRFGAVADFLDIYVGTYHWPAFNLADSFIVVGVGVMIWHSLFAAKQELAV